MTDIYKEKIAREIHVKLEMDRLLYLAMKKRITDPEDFMLKVVDKMYEPDNPNSGPVLQAAISIAFKMIERILAGDVYNKN